MTDLLTAIKEVEELVRTKHQPGQHPQSKHTPTAYGAGGGGGGGESAAGVVDNLNSQLGGVITNTGGNPDEGKAWGQFDIAHEADVKQAVESAGYEMSDEYGKMTAYSRGQFQGKYYSGSEMDVVVTGDKFGQGIGYVEVIDQVALDVYNVKMSGAR